MKHTYWLLGIVGLVMIVMGISCKKTQEYQVSFDMGGGSAISPMVTKQGHIASPDTPQLDGYQFEGWYLDQEGTNPIYDLSTYQFCEDTTVYAKWTKLQYTITYQLDGGKWPRNVLYTTRKEMVDDFMKDYNTFNQSSVVVSSFMDGSFSNPPVEEFFHSEQYKEKWAWLKQYIFKVCKDGKYVGISYLTDETNEYHNFYMRSNLHGFLNQCLKTGWPESFDFTKDAAANGYYDYLPGTNISYPTDFFVDTETFALVSPMKDYYQFDGWYDQNGNPVTEIKKGTCKNLVLTAHWKTDTYDISYELNGGSYEGLIMEYPSSSSRRLYLNQPNREGYAFLGFYETSDFSSLEVQYIEPGQTGNLHLYAKWSKEELGGHKTISFYGDSITSYENYIPSDGLFYYPIYSSTVKNPDLTWWKLAMEQTGTTYFSNISYAGSTVRGSSSTCGESTNRLQKIAKNGVAPDIIIVYLGINDCASGFSVLDFKTSYQNMLTKMKAMYPNSDIFICNLPYETWTDGSNPDGKNYPGLRESYNEAIEELSLENEAPCIDLAKVITKETESLNQKTYLGDNIHPNALGMAVIATKVVEELKKYYV